MDYAFMAYAVMGFPVAVLIIMLIIIRIEHFKHQSGPNPYPGLTRCPCGTKRYLVVIKKLDKDKLGGYYIDWVLCQDCGRTNSMALWNESITRDLK